jgi:hypothetical protein
MQTAGGFAGAMPAELRMHRDRQSARAVDRSERPAATDRECAAPRYISLTRDTRLVSIDHACGLGRRPEQSRLIALRWFA